MDASTAKVDRDVMKEPGRTFDKIREVEKVQIRDGLDLKLVKAPCQINVNYAPDSPTTESESQPSKPGTEPS